MIGHTDNVIDVDAPIDFVWRHTNDVADWPNLFSEYAAVDILDEGENSVTFRLTMNPDENGKTWSWVSQRSWDTEARTVRARRVEKGPFEFMNITWTYTELGDDRTRMRWIQDFEMKEGAPLDTAQMTDRINRNTPVQMELIKGRVEARRHRVLSFDAVPSNTKRGGDLRAMLTPTTVGSTHGFGGSLRLAEGEVVAEHYHPYSEEFLFVTAGRLRVDLNDEPVTMEAEQAILIPREVRHRITNVGDVEARMVFYLGPLAPRPELGHVDTESAESPQPVPAGAR